MLELELCQLHKPEEHHSVYFIFSSPVCPGTRKKAPASLCASLASSQESGQAHKNPTVSPFHYQLTQKAQESLYRRDREAVSHFILVFWCSFDHDFVFMAKLLYFCISNLLLNKAWTFGIAPLRVKSLQLRLGQTRGSISSGNLSKKWNKTNTHWINPIL